METKHTPGPWVTHGFYYFHSWRGDVFAHDAKRTEDCTPICRVSPPISKNAAKAKKPFINPDLEVPVENNRLKQIVEANARLIAAAPELLEALKGVLDIAKCWETLDRGKNIDLDASDAVKAARSAIARATGASS